MITHKSERSSLHWTLGTKLSVFLFHQCLLCRAVVCGKFLRLKRTIIARDCRWSSAVRYIRCEIQTGPMQCNGLTAFHLTCHLTACLQLEGSLRHRGRMYTIMGFVFVLSRTNKRWGLSIKENVSVFDVLTHSATSKGGLWSLNPFMCCKSCSLVRNKTIARALGWNRIHMPIKHDIFLSQANAQ